MRQIIALFAIILALIAHVSAYAEPATGLSLPPKVRPNGDNTFAFFNTFPASNYSSLCGYSSWYWGGTETAPDTTLGTCAYQTAYWAAFVYQASIPNLADGTKDIVWFLTNHPDWVLWQPPVRLSGTMTSGSKVITNVSLDPSLGSASDYVVAGHGQIPDGTTVTAITTTSITLSQNVACAALGNCGAGTILVTEPGYSTIVLHGTYTDGSNVISSVYMVPEDNAVLSSAAAGSGSFVTETSCAPGGTFVTATTTSQVTMNANATCTGTESLTIATPAFYNKFQTVNAPIDFTNAEAQQFLLYGCRTAGGDDCSMVGLINRGYRGISLDNVSPASTANAYGVYANAVGPCSGSDLPSCGGVLTKLFNATGYQGPGSPLGDYQDLALQKAWINWVRKIRQAVNGAGGILIANIQSIFPSTGAGPTDYNAAEMISNSVDIVGNEDAGTFGCNPYGVWYPQAGSYWTSLVDVLKNVTSPLAIYEVHLCAPTVTTTAGDEQTFAVATLLYLARHDYWVSFRGSSDPGNITTVDPSWTPDCGSVDASTTIGLGAIVSTDTAYERIFPGKCYVGINPSRTDTATMTLPAPPSGYKYVDLFGNTISSGTKTLYTSAESWEGATNTSVSSGTTDLHFAAGIMTSQGNLIIAPGMKVVNKTTPSSITSGTRIASIVNSGASGVTVTLDSPLAGNVSSGNVIDFITADSAMVAILVPL